MKIRRFWVQELDRSGNNSAKNAGFIVARVQNVLLRALPDIHIYIYSTLNEIQSGRWWREEGSIGQTLLSQSVRGAQRVSELSFCVLSE